MDDKSVEKLDQVKDNIEELWIQAISMRDSLRVFEYSFDNMVYDKHKDLSAIIYVYILLSDVLADRIKQALCELEYLLKDLK